MQFDERAKVFVADTLRRKLSTAVKDPKTFESWLTQVFSDPENPEAMRLATCMAFDLHLENMEPVLISMMVEVFENMSPELVHDPNLAFARAVENANRKCSLMTSIMRKHTGSETSDSFVRVLRLQAFINYYAGPLYGYTVDAADLKEVRQLYFSSDTTLEDITKAWSGRYDIVWVCSFQQFQDVLNNMNDPASFLNDALGLGFTSDALGNIPELVAILYPLGHPSESYQPRSLHADWDSMNFFVPYWDEDGWGRTQSCSGEKDKSKMKERIHKAYETGLSSEYRGQYLGPASSVVSDRDALYQTTTSHFFRVYGVEGNDR